MSAVGFLNGHRVALHGRALNSTVLDLDTENAVRTVFGWIALHPDQPYNFYVRRNRAKSWRGFTVLNTGVTGESFRDDALEFTAASSLPKAMWQ